MRTEGDKPQEHRWGFMSQRKQSRERGLGNMMEKRKILIVIMVIAASIFLATIASAAAAKTPEAMDSVLVQEAPIKEPAKNARSFDAFTMAFMGLSLGCMLIASAVHWTRSQRHSIENRIRDLAGFVDHNTSVTFHVAGGNSANPMVGITKEIAQNRDAALQSCDHGRTAMINTISSVETDIMRMWG